MDERDGSHSSLQVLPEDHEKISPVHSATEEPTPSPPLSTASPPPNGGTTAWLQVVGGWCIWFAAWYAHIIVLIPDARSYSLVDKS